eukprot:TRINITY_DN13021_c0_g1_i1.p3 TRINITY_DN13021_c0_g1~~TRINITY_DN13021_c0_g1_i1.p3  ORF type:complete len:121 (+),score=38.18 TRINITY_DN13021_c0_g1_i1:273-635(+)
MHYVNEYGKQVGHNIDLSPYDGPKLVQEFQKKGITKKSPKPAFIEQVFPETKHCKAWRATAGCSSQGKREPPNDEHCGGNVPADKSGYCQCTNGVRLNFECEEGRPPFTCDEVCQEPLED